MKKQTVLGKNSTANLSEILRTAVIEMQSSEQKTDNQEILKRRAIALSISKKSESTNAYFEYIQFGLANELFGIEKDFVKEVFPLRELTPLPCVPSFVVGIINVRGKILSVIDLKKFYDMPDTSISDLNRVIILHNNTLEFGILADKILGVRKAYVDELQKTLPTLKGIREDFLKGITPERVVILDHNKILNDDRLIINEKV